MTKVFIDGSAGTTGLRIRERLSGRKDIGLIILPEETRKDPSARAEALNTAAVSFLCLPDAAAAEAASFVTNPDAVIIDTSTAHRVAEGWVYGMPELAGQREKISTAKRIANPGCHATGFISCAAPLIRMGVVPASYPLTCFSLTGYSGGGKKMIANYESADKAQSLYAPGIYGLTLKHKHIPEMSKVCGLQAPPVFLPVVDDYYKGMATTIMLHNRLLPGAPTAQDICEKLQDYYKDAHFVSVMPFGTAGTTLYANELAGTNHLKIVVCGHEDQTSVTALFDNLGKGASGAAVQNMNIMLGIDEATGLE